ncbi:MAG: excinuclease ABC subunit UvrB [Candidatus Woesebacteria bacterium]|nr:excinuclease ABC subunit UvrB [Candidatus Woesebacteria bacterium]
MRGEKYQTLLGVTGSGKSLSYNERVLVYEKGNNSFKAFFIEIGKLVEDPTSVNKDLYVPSINPKTGQQELKPIIQLIRHETPKKMYSVTTSCGKQVDVTGDHNFWVIRNGLFKLVKTTEITKNDYLPTPRILEIKDLAVINTIYLKEYLKRDAYFKFNQIKNDIKKEELRKLLGYKKYYRIINKNEGISIRCIDSLNLSNKTLNNIKIYKKQGIPLKNEIHIDKNFLSLLGIYIAEGHSEKNYLLISVHENAFQKLFKNYLNILDIKYKERNFNLGDFQISNCLLSDLFSSMCGNKSSNKVLPPWFMQLDLKQLSYILSAYFSGDGTVTENEIQACTASSKLACDLSYALMRYGINVRIRNKIKYATNTINKVKRQYYEIVISGKENLTKFQKYIGFILERKQFKLSQIIKLNSNTNVDLTPIDGYIFKQLRKNIGFTHESLSKLVGCTRSYFSMIEDGSRKPSNKLLRKIVNIFEENTDSPLILSDLNKLKVLTEIFCTKVKEIKLIKPTSDYVYDIAVKDNETFLAGMGGIYVHNTFTVANVIEKLQRPTLIISHNKTLAGQLFQEMRDLFPENAVSYFVSYYDYYQPESYIPSTDTYIEKDSDINELIDKLRLAATTNLLTRKDVIVVASVSCIYNIGSPREYGHFVFEFSQGMKISRHQIIDRLLDLQYERSEFGFHRGTFRIRGEIVDIYPAYQDEAFRIELSEDKIKKVEIINPVFGQTIVNSKLSIKNYVLYPAKHFMTDPTKNKEIISQIEKDMINQYNFFKKQGKLLEAQRIKQKVTYDLEMIQELGYVKGIENYSRYFDGRAPGEAPYSLLDYFNEPFGKDWLVIADESHMTFPQVRGMYAGDFSRKSTLIDYGFRLPSAIDNRPLKFDEFMRKIPNFIALSATPSEWELSMSGKCVVEQLVRPTGIPDPLVEIRPIGNQVADCIKEIKKQVAKHQRTLVTTLTKKTAEDLSAFLEEKGLKVHYLHSDVKTLDRGDILDSLRKGKYDVLVGINLLREGLDLPEVSLVAILDADKEGFLRSDVTLIQTMGRAARHVEGRVIMYADTLTGSMRRALSEVARRRAYQIKYNKIHNITPKSIQKPIRERLIENEEEQELEKVFGKKESTFQKLPHIDLDGLTPMDKKRLIIRLKREMVLAAQDLNFELAAEIRDKIREIAI